MRARLRPAAAAALMLVPLLLGGSGGQGADPVRIGAVFPLSGPQSGGYAQEELAGVLGHELGHIKHRDTLTMTITATIAGAIGMLANFAFFFGAFGGRNDDRNNPLGIIGVILIAILAPIAAALVQLAISRAREYEADRAGAEISGHPLWLASALEKIDAHARQVANPVAAAHPATAHLFIVNPLSGGRMDNLFASHPSTENRIRRLRQMAGVAGPWG